MSSSESRTFLASTGTTCLKKTSSVLELRKHMGSDPMTSSPDGGSAVSCVDVLAFEGLSARGIVLSSRRRKSERRLPAPKAWLRMRQQNCGVWQQKSLPPRLHSTSCSQSHERLPTCSKAKRSRTTPADTSLTLDSRPRSTKACCSKVSSTVSLTASSRLLKSKKVRNSSDLASRSSAARLRSRTLSAEISRNAVSNRPRDSWIQSRQMAATSECG